MNRRIFIEILGSIGLFGNLYKLGNIAFKEKSEECYLTYEDGVFNICSEKDGIILKGGYIYKVTHPLAICGYTTSVDYTFDQTGRQIDWIFHPR